MADEWKSKSMEVIAGKLAKREALTPEEVDIYERSIGKKYTGPQRAKTYAELKAEAEALEKRLTSAGGSAGSTAEWGRLGKLKEEMKEAAAFEKVKIEGEPGPKPVAPKAKPPVPMEGGELAPKPLAPVVAAPVAPSAPMTGIRPQPMAAPMPSKAGPIQGEAMPTVPGMPISAMPMVKPPPPELGPAPMGEGEQAAGESVPEARAFWDYLQKIQGKGDLVAENPMYLKAFDDATPAEKDRLIKENPEYFKKFRAEIGGLIPEAGTKYEPYDKPLNTGGLPKGEGPQVAKPMPEPPSKVAEAVAGVPDWIRGIGEVLQAGMAGAHGETDIGRTAYGKRIAEAAKKEEANTEAELMEKWKKLERGWSVEDRDFAAKESAAADAREKALIEAGWSVEDARADRENRAAWERMKYQTDAQSAAAKAAATKASMTLAEYEALLASLTPGG